MEKNYFAYGSNLNSGQMAIRCPNAVKLHWRFLDGYRLVFRPVADIVPDENCQAPVGFWRITERCLAALDRYEGYPTLYGRHYFKAGGKRYFTYRMKRKSFFAPSESYLNGIKEGYGDFGMDKSAFDLLEEAVAYSAERQICDPRLLYNKGVK